MTTTLKKINKIGQSRKEMKKNHTGSNEMPWYGITRSTGLFQGVIDRLSKEPAHIVQR